MRLSPLQMQQLVEKVFRSLKEHQIVTFKDSEKKVIERGIAAVKENYDEEASLDIDVNKMLDQLERSNPGEFQRHKMFTLVKQKLAKERKFVL